jgi:hypothetical protein
VPFFLLGLWHLASRHYGGVGALGEITAASRGRAIDAISACYLPFTVNIFESSGVVDKVEGASDG